MKTMKDAAIAALNSQNACNLSGVIFSFAQAMQIICDESHRLGEGTDWRNRHPISVLFSTQIAYLTHTDLGKFEVYHNAAQACEDMAAS